MTAASKTKMVALRIGAMCPKPSEQIKGLDDQFDKDAEALVRLAVRGILSDSEKSKAGQRLVNKIAKHIQEKSNDDSK